MPFNHREHTVPPTRPLVKVGNDRVMSLDKRSSQAFTVRINRPPPHPILPAVRHAILELFRSTTAAACLLTKVAAYEDRGIERVRRANNESDG